MAFAAALLATPVLVASPAQAFSNQQWALTYLKADQVWQVTKGSNVTVAVIDTGVASVSDLNGQVLSGADFSAGTTSSGNGRTDTADDGHGTGMASVIAANGSQVEGLAPAAKILPVRVAVSNGAFLPDNIAAGIQYAVSRHVGVINLSIGNQQDLGTGVSAAIAQAVAANIVVVASTGNDSATTVSYPAAYPGVVAVGAIDQNGQLWSQSNTGAQVVLTAPGVGIYRDNNLGQQGTSSGTSEATAYVSATAALIRSAHPDWSAGQVIRDLISTADPASGQSAGQRSSQYGYGVVDPLKALQASAPSDTSNPLLSPAAGSSPSTGASSDASTTAAAPTSSSHTGPIIGGLVGVIVVVGVVLLIVSRSRRNRGGVPR
jgi:type VII secretion-associated serine protease mycosin